MEGIKMLQEKIIDLSTGQEIVRDYTPEQLAEVAAEEAKAEALAAEQAKKLAEKTAVFTKLGLTEEEVAALFS
jgi:hypothetical protein